MHWVFMVARYAPFLGLGLMAACAQIANFYRRKGSKKMMGLWLFILVMILVGVCAWFYLRGYENSDDWVRSVTGLMPPA